MRKVAEYLMKEYRDKISPEKVLGAMLTEWTNNKGLHHFEEVRRGKRQLMKRWSK